MNHTKTFNRLDLGPSCISQDKAEETWPAPVISECPNLQTYFHTLVKEALIRQKVRADEHVSFYLVNLLSAFSHADHTYVDEDGSPTPLAMLFYQAQHESIQNRIRLLKYLGDCSLMVSGFFQESLNRKPVDVDYYINLGAQAYGQLSSLNISPKNQNVFNMIFSDLGDRFVQWVDVISDVSETTHLSSSSDLLRTYERFMKTGSKRLKETLFQKGIFPNEDWQTAYRQ